MENPNAPFKEFAIRGAHPALPRSWLTLTLPDEIAPHIQMKCEPMISSMALTPAAARAVAGALVEFAEASERREEADANGVVWATDGQGTWIPTDADTEVDFLGDGEIVVTTRPLIRTS